MFHAYLSRARRAELKTKLQTQPLIGRVIATEAGGVLFQCEGGSVWAAGDYLFPWKQVQYLAVAPRPEATPS